MSNLKSLKGLVVAVCLVIISFYFIGCEQIPFLSPPKTGTSATKSVKIPMVTGTVVAKVNNYPIVLEDLNEEVDSFNALVPEDRPEVKITTPEQKVEYLKNEMVRRSLLYQEAQSRGLDSNPEIQRILEKTKADLLVMELVRKEAESVVVTYDEINNFYETYKEQLKDPEERHLREIVVNTEEEERGVIIQIYQGVDFAALAVERSKAASKDKGGDLGFIQRGVKSPQFDVEAFSDTLEVGKTSNYFKGPEGYYIVKLEEKRGGAQKELSDIWDDIKRELTFVKQQAAIEQLIADLSNKAKIEYYEGEIQ